MIANEPPFFIQKGEDPRVLILGFTGFGGRLLMNAFDFFQVSGLLKYSRILLRDDSRRCYLGGVDPIAGSVAELLDWIRERIRELAPEKVLAVGASAGASCALVVGQELKLDYTHAFAPFTFLDLPNVVKNHGQKFVDLFGDSLQRIWALPQEVHKYFDLAEVLKTSNGVTRHNIHICRDSGHDVQQARHVIGCPNVNVFAYPCAKHGVTHYLTLSQKLLKILSIENQENLKGVLDAEPYTVD